MMKTNPKSQPDKSQKGSRASRAARPTHLGSGIWILDSAAPEGRLPPPAAEPAASAATLFWDLSGWDLGFTATQERS